jgi:hypothetical protein
MADGAVPVPAGATFVPSAPAANPDGTVPVPAGATFVPSAPPEPSMLQRVGQQTLNFNKGIAEGAGQTGNSIVHATDAVGNYLGDKMGLPGQASVQDIAGNAPAGTGAAGMNQLTTPTTIGEKVGVGAESIAEFFAGDEALKGLSISEQMLQAGKLADTFDKASPFAKATMEAVMNTARTGGVSAAQTLAHGGTVGQAATSFGTVAALGAVGAGTGKVLDWAADNLATPEVTAYARDLSNKVMDKEMGSLTPDIAQRVVDAMTSGDYTGLTPVQKAMAQSAGKGVQAGIDAVSTTPAALYQVVKDVAGHLPAAAAKATIGYLVYKSSLPDVIKESVIIGLGLHELGGLGDIVKTPEAKLLLGNATDAVTPMLPRATQAAQSVAAPVAANLLDPNAEETPAD